MWNTSHPQTPLSTINALSICAKAVSYTHLDVYKRQAQISKSEQDERGLLPYPVIIAATKGDPEAMNIVVQHYESYIASLSMRKLRDERGNIYWGIDEDIRDRLRSRLMRAVLSFKV